MSAPDLRDYIEVKDRIKAFHMQYPDGSLDSEWGTVEIAGETLIIVRAWAYRTPDDQRPGRGTASEPFPGKTPYTKDSELMNAETSAWGRALAALGFEVNRAVTSREEVEARQGKPTGPGAPIEDRKPTEPQMNFLLGQGNRKGLIDKAPLTDEAKVHVKAWVSDKLTFETASSLITMLKEDPDKGASYLANIAGFSDTPIDDEGLPTVDEALAEDTRPVNEGASS